MTTIKFTKIGKIDLDDYLYLNENQCHYDLDFGYTFEDTFTPLKIKKKHELFNNTEQLSTTIINTTAYYQPLIGSYFKIVSPDLKPIIVNITDSL